MHPRVLEARWCGLVIGIETDGAEPRKVDGSSMAFLCNGCREPFLVTVTEFPNASGGYSCHPVCVHCHRRHEVILAVEYAHTFKENISP